MTADKITQLASQSPVLALTTRLGELKDKADRETANLTMTLKEIDKTRDDLLKEGVTMSVDLGPIGNAAALERRKPVEKRTFTLPTGAAA